MMKRVHNKLEFCKRKLLNLPDSYNPCYLNTNLVYTEIDPDNKKSIDRADKVMLLNFLYDYATKAELAEYIWRVKDNAASAKRG